MIRSAGARARGLTYGRSPVSRGPLVLLTDAHILADARLTRTHHRAKALIPALACAGCAVSESGSLFTLGGAAAHADREGPAA
jgi:hypothetical protein